MLLALIPIAFFLLPSIVCFFILRGIPTKRWAIIDGELNTDKDFYFKNQKSFIDCIETHGLKKIVTGEANHKIFTKPVVDKMGTPNKPVGIIAGPLLSVGEDRKSHLVEAAKENRIVLYYSPTRQKIHYRFSDTHLHIEQPHAPLAKKRSFTNINHIPGEIKRYKRLFNAIKKEVTLSDNPSEDFLFLTDEDFDKIKSKYENSFELTAIKALLSSEGIDSKYAAN